MSDNVVKFPSKQSGHVVVEMQEIHDMMDNASYFVLVAVNEENLVHVMTNLVHVEAAQSVLAEAMEELDDATDRHH